MSDMLATVFAKRQSSWLSGVVSLGLVALLAVAGCDSDETATHQPSSGTGGAGTGASGTGAGSVAGGGTGQGGTAMPDPFVYTRPEEGDPVPDTELAEVTNLYLELLSHTRYFDFVDERAHGWPLSDPQQRYWFSTWWSGVVVQKAGGKISYVHQNEGADNNGLRTAPLLEAACYAVALWNDSGHELLLRKLMRGHSAWLLSMERDAGESDKPLLSRTFYPESITSTDGGLEIHIDYSQNRPGNYNGVSEYVHLPNNPLKYILLIRLKVNTKLSGN